MTPTSGKADDLSGNLRQMIAVLQQERQALAGLSSEDLLNVATRKQELCDVLSPFGPESLDPATRELVETARSLNEVNRRVRNLLAANVASRLEALSDIQPSYSPNNPAAA